MCTINEASAIAVHQTTCKIFKAVERLLSDGRNYLVGNQFSAADLTFATLAAAVVIPEGYGVKLPELSQLPAQMVTQIQLFQTSAGKFVLRLYREYGEPHAI
jgi:glutathione S-transferase